MRHDSSNRLWLACTCFREKSGDLVRRCNEFGVAPGLTVNDKREPVRITASNLENAVAGPI